MMFSAMLMDTFQDSDTDFPIRYRFDGNILNPRRLQANTKVQTDVLDELQYADDIVRIPTQRQNAKSHGSSLTVM